MPLRELISWKDVAYCVIAAIAMTFVFCGIPYLAAGGPVPLASTTAYHQHPVALRMNGPYEKPATVPRVMTAALTAYQVQSGDSLSKISGHFYHNPNDWPVLFWANKGRIHYPDMIETGQVLSVPALPAHIPAPPAVSAPSSPRPVTDAAPSSAQTQQESIEQAAPARTASSVPSSGYAVSSAFQACVIRAESGGNAQAWNPSGHYGLYQFSAATWAAYGGSPADFGHASAAEQTQVFDSAMATGGGASNWSPYDGC